MTDLNRIADKLEALRLLEREEPACPPVGVTSLETESADIEHLIGQLELEHSLTFPPDYRAFRLRFGNSAIGPGNYFPTIRDAITPNSAQPFPLTTPFLGQCSPEFDQLPEAQKWEVAHHLMDACDAIPKDHGVIDVSD